MAEDLIKSLTNATLGQDDRDEERASESRDKGSRSTGAQVVSGKQDSEEREWGSSGSWPSMHPQKQMHNWSEYKCSPVVQKFSDEVEYSDKIEPSEEELADLSSACNKLWELDFNRLVPGKDYQINCGKGKKVFGKKDMAKDYLFTELNKDIFKKPTFFHFCSLLDNYNPEQRYDEVITSEELEEQEAFMKEISKTAPIKYLYKYLSSKRIVPQNYQYFIRMMTSLWFDLYGRGGSSNSSSTFEHVFVGEIKHRNEQEVSGFHNWLQFYLEEAKGRVDYQGYIKPQIPNPETQLLTIQFKWNGVLKSVSSTLIGVSPEFEIALYTLCFYVGKEDNHVQLGPYSVNIKCHYQCEKKLGSAYPELIRNKVEP